MVASYPSTLVTWLKKLQRVLLEPLDLSRRQALPRWHPLFMVRWTLAVGRQWARDRCPQKAGMLTFQTALSLVPLIAICFAVLQRIHLVDAQQAITQFVSRHVIPVEANEIIERLIGFAQNISASARGFTGILSTAIIAFALFNTVERAFNEIWRVGKRRSLFDKLRAFLVMMIVAPIVIGISLYYTTQVWRASHSFGILGPLTSIFLGLLFTNKLLPNTRAQWRACAIGAMVSAVLFEGAKQAFGYYVAAIASTSFNGIYGPLGLIPIFLLWVYYTWLVILFGAEVAYTTQNFAILEEAEYRRAGAHDREENLRRKLNGTVAARLMLSVCEHFAAGNKAVPRLELMQNYKISEDVFDAVFDRLKHNDLVVEVFLDDEPAYMPARPLDDISVDEALSVFERDTLSSAPPDAIQELDEKLSQIRAERLKGISFAALLQEKKPPSTLPADGGPEHQEGPTLDA